MNERTDTSCLLQAFLHLSEGFIGVADPSAGHAPPEYVPDRVMVILENAEHLPTCRLQELEGKAGRHMIVPSRLCRGSFIEEYARKKAARWKPGRSVAETRTVFFSDLSAGGSGPERALSRMLLLQERCPASRLMRTSCNFSTASIVRRTSYPIARATMASREP
jgi:hypothetical protein